jgi:cell division protein ZapA (FtsZ GTPase activity inhibitor)
MQAKIKIQGEEYAIECAECYMRRIEDLARALEERLEGFKGETGAKRRLVLAALGLLDEVQATSAALARARNEIERLTDTLVEAKLEAQPPPGKPDAPARRDAGALRVAQGRA